MTIISRNHRGATSMIRIGIGGLTPTIDEQRRRAADFFYFYIAI
jgi:hypothetical protein